MSSITQEMLDAIDSGSPYLMAAFLSDEERRQREGRLEYLSQRYGDRPAWRSYCFTATLLVNDASEIFDDTVSKVCEGRPPGVVFDTVDAFIRECRSAIGDYGSATVRRPAEHRRHYDQLAARIRTLIDEIRADVYLGAESSTFLDPLTNLAEQVELVASTGPLSDRPGNERRAARIYFIKRLSKWNREHFGRPMEAMVASATNALFPDLEQIDATYVNNHTKKST